MKEKYNIIENVLYASLDETIIDDFNDLLNEFNDEINKKLKIQNNFILQSPSSKVILIVCCFDLNELLNYKNVVLTL